MTTGLVVGKFLPPHRGHLRLIFEAYTKVDRLIVVICERTAEETELCQKAGFREYLSGEARKQILAQELQGFQGIELKLLKETGIPPYPLGWDLWLNRLAELVGPFNRVFGSEPEYRAKFEARFPGVSYHVFDASRSEYPISGTEVRENYLKHWSMIVGSARPFLARRVLITGTESCGKTTLTRMLAKTFCTSWSEEVGRDYSAQYLGGDETIFTEYDFLRIAGLQAERDQATLRAANKIAFFDTDAVVTKYYGELYLGRSPHGIEAFIQPKKYDAILILAPSVPWVADGMRLHGNAGERQRLHKKLLAMTLEAYPGVPHCFIERPEYNYRYRLAAEIVKELIHER